MQHEERCVIEGYTLIAGIDEVGMGCLAGPVVASAVILNPHDFPLGINDSKKLSPKKRESLALFLKEKAIGYSIAYANVEEIDSLNIYHAARLAMKRALEKLSPHPDFVLLDGRGKVDCSIPQKAIVRGDQVSLSIAAASILAKVYRDQWMLELDGEYPGYGFASHKGYGSVLHRKALQERGRTPIHRKTFSWTPV